MRSRPPDKEPLPISGDENGSEDGQSESDISEGSALVAAESVPGAQGPIEVEEIKLGKSHATAAGVEGVRQSLRYAWGRMGVVRGTQTLLKLNQVDGFDCQSCAWPNSDARRHKIEFCENGAKAASDEGTSARVTPEFFVAH